MRQKTGTVVVKKYGNRRLYDTEQSRYVTLEELAQRIRAGTDVRVVDAKTGGDLTQATLAQIIIEDRGAGRLLPVPLLLQLIRLGDHALAEFLGQYVSMALNAYLQARQGIQAIAPYTPFGLFSGGGLGGPLGGFPGMGGGYGSPYDAPRAPPQQAPVPPAQPPQAAEHAPAGRGEDLATLRRELDELKASLREAPARGRKKKA